MAYSKKQKALDWTYNLGHYVPDTRILYSKFPIHSSSIYTTSPCNFFQQIVAANGSEIMEEIKCNLSVWVISLLSYESRRQMMATIIPYCCYTAPPRISLRPCCCFSNCCFIASFCSIVLMIIRVELFKHHTDATYLMTSCWMVILTGGTVTSIRWQRKVPFTLSVSDDVAENWFLSDSDAH